MPRVRIRRAPVETSGYDAFPVSPPEQEEGINPGAVLAGGAVLVGAGLLARRPGLVGKGLSRLNAVRQQLMLSGFALPKSLLGNVGAGVTESLERGTFRPLKEVLSRRTLRGARAAYRTGGFVDPAISRATGGATIPGPTPGRLMGAFDVATRNALQRAGLSAQEAERAILQSPLTGDLGQALESGPARFVFPFRRTPFNQFIEGLKIARTRQHPRLLAAYLAAGGLHGAATADERYPLSVPFGVALSARYGLPYAAAALMGRALAGARTSGGIESSALPVSEYGFKQAFTSPHESFEPAALRALRRLLDED